jgi:asparagine N-glycosylation enzyme membrane subunit Stt3
MLGVWMCLRLYDRPTTGNQILAGFAIGLAIASRYFMVALIPVLLAVGGMILWRQISQADKLKATWVGIGAGVLAVAVGFAVTTPYFFLDFTTAWQEVTYQAGHSNHLGADGLSPPENFLWYLTRAIPLSITWPEAILAASGVALAVWRRRFNQILLVLFTVVFLVGISRAPLHWQRWIIQILPLFALFAAYGLNAVIERLSAHLSLRPSAQRGLVLLAVVLLAASPAYELVLQDIRQATPSTRILAREWIFANVPVGSRLAQEWYTAPSLGDAHLDVLAVHSLGGRGLGDYRRGGFEYLVVSSWMYDRYLAEPQRYGGQALFYRSLFEEGDLLQRFRPSNTRGGPEIRIYRLATATAPEAQPPDGGPRQALGP